MSTGHVKTHLPLTSSHCAYKRIIYKSLTFKNCQLQGKCLRTTPATASLWPPSIVCFDVQFMKLTLKCSPASDSSRGSQRSSWFLSADCGWNWNGSDFPNSVNQPSISQQLWLANRFYIYIFTIYIQFAIDGTPNGWLTEEWANLKRLRSRFRPVPLIDALCLPCGHSNWCLHVALEVLCKHEILADQQRKGILPLLVAPLPPTPELLL